MDDILARIGEIFSVSILVFVELALDGYTRRLAVWEELKFQSLFSWNLLLMLTEMVISRRDT